LETHRAASSSPRQETSVAGLDEILGGGLPSHRLYVVEGDPGSGKTTLALQFLLEGARRGQKCLYVTLSETLEELHDVAASHGWSLDELNLLELDSIAERLAEEANYTVFRASDVELGETVKRIRAEVERIDPARVVLDSVSELKILSQTSVRYRREILALKQFFAGRKCTVLILDDLTTGEGEQQLQSIAHGVIRLERESREYGATRRQIRVLKMRAVEFTDGCHDFIIKRGGIVLYPRLSAAGGATVDTGDLAASGSAELDSLLGGGLDRGASALIMGPAGAGKTTICSQYLIAALGRGEHVAAYLFEETPATFLKRSDGLGMNFRPHLESGLFDLVQADLAVLSPGEFSSRAKEAVEKKNATIIVIDSLNGYLNGMPSERYLLIHMHALLTYLGQKGVATILTLAQHGVVGGAIHAPIDLSFLADTVMLLRYFEADGLVRQAVSIVKKRRGGHERSIRELRITSGGLRVGEVLKNFRGVLTGVPEYRGTTDKLLEDKPGE
jgi:circadian clock protein KaiC